MDGGQVLTDAIGNEIKLPETVIICSSLPHGIKIITEILLLNGYKSTNKREFRRE